MFMAACVTSTPEERGNVQPDMYPPEKPGSNLTDHGTARRQLDVAFGDSVVDADGADAGRKDFFDARFRGAVQARGHRVAHLNEVRGEEDVPVGISANGHRAMVDNSVEAQLRTFHVFFHDYA